MAEITPEAKKTDGITNDLVEIVQPSIEKMIYVIRDKQVMLDSDLAVLYQVETGALNRAVKRNISRFPEDFRFQLTKKEYQNLRCQTGISSLAQGENNYGGRRTLPYVFTEQGISMLASVLHSEVAIKVSIGIMRTFVEMRRFITPQDFGSGVFLCANCDKIYITIVGILIRIPQDYKKLLPEHA